MKKTIIIIALALSFVDCQKTGELTTEDGLLEFGYEGGTQSLSFDITEKWTARLNDAATDWCTIDINAGGAGHNTINVAVSPNEGDARRYGTIAVMSGGLNRYFTISQAYYIPEIQIFIEHSLTEFPALQFAGGKDLSGTVNWGDDQGDDQGDDYTEGHTYAYEGAKTVEYTIFGADSLTIKSLDSIDRIIISK